MEINLSGNWKTAFDDGKKGLDSKWYEPTSFPREIRMIYLPTFIFSFPFQDTKSAWCKKQFSIDRSPEGYVYLVFYLTDQGTVWLNGKLAGELERSAKKQVFDVTNLLEKENTLIIHFDDLMPDSLGVGKDIFLIENIASPQISRYTVTHTPKWVDSAVIYSIYTRNFTEEGTFESVLNKIPYLKQLGVNTLWFMPIHEIGAEQRKGSLGSPYSIQDYYSVSSELGTKEDFRKVVDAAHEAGMKVIIDLVINHTSHDSVMKSIDPDFYKPPEINNAVAWGWEDVTELNYAYPPTREYIREMMGYWIREFDLDGFRCDVAFLVPLDFWKNAIDYIRSIKSDIVMLAESDNPLLYTVGFDLTYDWGYMGLLHRFSKGMYQFSDIVDYILSQYEYFPQNAKRMICLENHDTQRISDTIPEADLTFFQILKFITPGVPLIYNGEEFGAHHAPSLFEKDAVDWSVIDGRIVELYKKLIGLKKYASLNYHMRDSFDVSIYKKNVEWVRRNLSDVMSVHFDFNNRTSEFTHNNNSKMTVDRIIGEDNLLFTKNRI